METMFFHTKPEKGKRRRTFAGIVVGNVIRIGVAMCSRKDQFQKRLGRMIAEGRAKKDPITYINVLNDSPIKTFIEYVKNLNKANPSKYF